MGLFPVSRMQLIRSSRYTDKRGRQEITLKAVEIKPCGSGKTPQGEQKRIKKILPP